MIFASKRAIEIVSNTTGCTDITVFGYCSHLMPFTIWAMGNGKAQNICLLKSGPCLKLCGKITVYATKLILQKFWLICDKTEVDGLGK